MLEAIIKKLEGEIAMAKANIDIYINSSTGIGEHPEIAEAVESQIEKIAAAHEKIQTIEEYF
jgi:undecaprenyl pyrophosphate synthase